jgi:hypothetical protein
LTVAARFFGTALCSVKAGGGGARATPLLQFVDLWLRFGFPLLLQGLSLARVRVW